MLKTFRADPSDVAVFANAGAPGEWAVSGAFAYALTDIGALPTKARAGFKCGFLGLKSLGRSTLVQVVTASAAVREAAVNLLAQRLVDRFGAPDLETARTAAEEEVAFSVELAQQPVGRLLAVRRHLEEGAVREEFRVLSPLTAGGPIEIRALDEERIDERA